MSRLISFWKEKFIGKNENSPAFRKSMAERIDGSSLKYVSERIDDCETVLCHKGCITVSGEDIIISGVNEGTVFRSKITETKMNELLSKEGIIFTGNDLAHECRERCVVAYYTYYRKV